MFRGYVSFREGNPYSPVDGCLIKNLAEKKSLLGLAPCPKWHALKDADLVW